MAELVATAQPLVVRNLPRANFVSFLAIAIVEFAVPFLAVSALGATSAIVSLLAVARFLPALLAAESASRYVTAHGYRQAMVVAEILRVVAFAAAVAGALFTSQGIVWFVVSLAVVSVAGALSGVAIGDAVPYLTQGAGRVQMYSRLSIAESGADAVGPFAGGVLLAWVSAPPAFVICAVLAALAVRLFTSLPRQAPVERVAAPEGALTIVTGLRVNLGEPVIRKVFMWMLLYNLGQSVVMAVFLIAVTGELGLDAQEYGLLASVVVIFAIVGAWWAGRVVPRAGWAGRLFQLSGISTMAAYVLIALCFAAPVHLAVVLLAVCLAVEEFFSAITGILISGYRAAYVPEAMRPASIAANRACVAISVVIGYAVGGLLGLYLAPIPLMVGSGLVMLVASVVWLAPSRVAHEIELAHTVADAPA